MRDKEKAVLAVGVLGLVGGTIYFATKAKAAPPVPPEDIVISSLIIEPGTVYVGEPVSISVTATNIGEAAGSHEVTCETEGGFMKKTVSLNPGESKVVTFTYTPTVAKGYTVSADGLSGTFVAIGVPEARFEVTGLVIKPAEVYVGETVTISVVVTNVGGEAGSCEVTLEVT